MTAAHLSAIDLNLLVHLEALLHDAHVTRAARRVGLTQSAMSRSLTKLRALLGDPILVRTARGLAPTPRARDLLAPLRAALGTLEAVVHDRPTFDPRTSTRTFTLISSDYTDVIVLPRLLAHFASAAPGIDLGIVSGGREGASLLEEEGADFVLGLKRDAGANTVWRKLFHEDFVCVLRRGHPALVRRLTLERFLALPQVLVAPGGRPGGLLDDALAAIGRRRRVAVRVSSFLVAPLLVAATDLVATLPRRLAEQSTKILPLARIPLPIRLGGFDVHLAWHERHQRDPGHRWLRETILALGQ